MVSVMTCFASKDGECNNRGQKHLYLLHNVTFIILFMVLSYKVSSALEAPISSMAADGGKC